MSKPSERLEGLALTSGILAFNDLVDSLFDGEPNNESE
jgi:hypothetical protein